MEQAAIDQIGEKVGRLETADHILAWDRKQAPTLAIEEIDEAGEKHYRTVPNPDARRCQANKKHGLLAMHGNGASLVCCESRPSPCSYSEPVSR